MRIIQLGNLDVTFCCPNCRTTFEVSTNELKFKDGEWFINCPLCDEKMVLRSDTFVKEFLERRERLKKEGIE